MTDREKVIKGLKCCCSMDMCFDGCPYHETSQNIDECTSQLALEALGLLKEQEAITQKMWNALYAEEDELEKKFTQTDKQNEWIMEYRPWLQRGFEIAIRVIAEWEECER